MKLDVLTNILETAGLGTVGTDIFQHFMPAECEQGILIKMPLKGVEICHELPGYYHTEVQTVVRAQSQEAGEELATQVQAALTIEQRTSYPADGMTINQMLPKTLPIRYPRSDGNGIEWSIHFRVSFVQQ